MPNITPVVLTDGTTPLTLNPKGKVNNKTTFLSANAANRAAQSRLTVQVIDGKDSQRVISRLNRPLSVVNADTGLTEVIETMVGEANFRIPYVAETDDRETFLRLFFSQLADSTLKTVLEAGDDLY